MESRHSTTTTQVDQKLDDQFVKILTKIERKYLIFNRHVQIRIEKWVEKLLRYDENTVWRRIRNNYITVLYEMVNRKKIEGIFLRMPPEKDLPNFTDIQNRRMIHDHQLAQTQSTQTNHQISIKKIQEPCGDTASQVATPNCQTERTLTQAKAEQQCESHHTSKASRQSQKQSKTKYENANIGNKTIIKIVNLFTRHEEIMKKDQSYQQIMASLNQILHGKANISNLSNNTFEVNEGHEQSTQLRVEEGIQVNKANLFQFGSPRGMTQMQYFKAALQL